MKTFLGLSVLSIFLAGCGLLIPPKEVGEIATYNAQVYQLLTHLATTLATIAGFVGLWIKANIDKTDNAAKITAAAEKLAIKTEAAAEVLVAKTELVAKDAVMAAQVQTAEVLAQVKEGLDVNIEAIKAGNHTNDKIMELQTQIAQQTNRKRATDG